MTLIEKNNVLILIGTICSVIAIILTIIRYIILIWKIKHPNQYYDVPISDNESEENNEIE